MLTGNLNVNHLYTIPFSHYNEQARWVLDHHSITYKEHKYLPGYHLLPLALAKKGKGNKDRISTAHSTPCLVHEHGVLHDSVDIMRAIDQQNGGELFSPSGIDFEEVLKQVNHYHDYLGPHTRRMAYFYILNDSKVFIKTARKNVGIFQSVSLPFVYRGFKLFISKGLNITADRAEKSAKYINQEIQLAEALLEDGRPFLLGDQFSAADIAFSSMLAPALLPSVQEGYGGVLPSVDEVPADFSEFVKRCRDSKGGQHALKMFATKRRKSHGNLTESGAPSTLVKIKH